LNALGLIAYDDRGIRDRLPLRIFHQDVQVAGRDTLSQG
jgi:hypothetical protein